MINEHLISLGINPKVPPVELLSEDFIQKLNEHAADNDEAKASEMEHAIRKHCTVYFDEVPSFYKSLSEKVENLIEKHQVTKATSRRLKLFLNDSSRLKGWSVRNRVSIIMPVKWV